MRPSADKVGAETGRRVLVTGGAGVMGRRLSEALRDRGYRTRILALAGDALARSLESRGFEVAYGDVTRPETLPPALAGIEIVYHLAAVLLSPLDPGAFARVNAEGTRHLVGAAEAAGVAHLILVSSISVLYPWSNAYARSKRAAEDIVRASRIPRVTVVRPSLAYEDGGSAEFLHFVGHLRRFPLVLLPGGGRARKSPVHVDDLVAGFLSLAGNAKAHGKTYHFTGGDVLELREMARLLLAHMGRPKPVLGFPLWLGFLMAAGARAAARITGRAPVVTVQSLTGLVQDAVAPDTAAAEDLGYRPRTFREGLATLYSLRGSQAP